MSKIRKWWRHFRHNVLGWHNCRGAKTIGFDGCSSTGKCSCGKRVLQDSQGNWF